MVRDGGGRTSEIILYACMTLGVIPVLIHVDVDSQDLVVWVWLREGVPSLPYCHRKMF